MNESIVAWDTNKSLYKIGTLTMIEVKSEVDKIVTRKGGFEL